MDIKEYISSGIIENYVLDSVSKQERQEVECMSHIYPEIKEALFALQANIEKLALKVAVIPPSELKARVMEKIKTETQDMADNSRDDSSGIIPISSAKNTTLFKLIAAASIVLVLGVTFYAYKVNSDLVVAQNEVANSNEIIQQLQTDYDALNGSNQDMSNELALLSSQMLFVRNQNTAKINLAGTEGYEDNAATVFWNKESEKVMLDVQNLPTIASNESYQLWVLVDGQPVDMGVFDIDSAVDTFGLMEMKSADKADAFAITREPSGGSESPTLDQLHVIGTL